MHTLALLSVPPILAGLLAGGTVYLGAYLYPGGIFGGPRGVFGGPALPSAFAGVVGFAVTFVVMVIVVVLLDLRRVG